MPGLFPIYLKLTARRCLVVGAGNIAESKIVSMVEAEAEGVLLNNQAKVSRRIKALEVEDKDEDIIVEEEDPMDMEPIGMSNVITAIILDTTPPIVDPKLMNKPMLQRHHMM